MRKNVRVVTRLSTYFRQFFGATVVLLSIFNCIAYMNNYANVIDIEDSKKNFVFFVRKTNLKTKRIVQSVCCSSEQHFSQTFLACPKLPFSVLMRPSFQIK